MKRFEVGYEDEFIGIFRAVDAEDAKRQCREAIRESGVELATPPRARLAGLIANEVNY